jgi:hypothetical protein
MILLGTFVPLPCVRQVDPFHFRMVGIHSVIRLKNRVSDSRIFFWECWMNQVASYFHIKSKDEMLEFY